MNLNYEQIYSNISNEQLKTSKIICFALGVGITLFFAITIFFYYKNFVPDPNILEEPYNLFYLKYACLIVFCILLLLSYFQPLKIIKPEFDEIRKTDISENEVDKLMGTHRTYLIIRLAMLEGAGLFGLVVFFMSILDQTIYSFQIYWVCLIPAAVMLIYVIILFPTKAKVSNFILENMT